MENPSTHATSPSVGETVSAAATASDCTACTLEVIPSQHVSEEQTYEFLIKGEITEGPQLSVPGQVRIRELADSARLVSGVTVDESQEYTLSGEIVAFDCDDPTSTIRLDGTEFTPDYWPAISDRLYTKHGSIPDPFSQTGILGSSPNDPLDSNEYVITLQSESVSGSCKYRFCFEGDIISSPDQATIPDAGMCVAGSLEPGDTATIRFCGLVTEIAPDDGIDIEITQC